MKLRHSRGRFRRAVNRAKRFVAVGLVSGLMVLGGACQSKKKDQPQKKPAIVDLTEKVDSYAIPNIKDCTGASRTRKIVRISGLLTTKHAKENRFSHGEVTLNVKSGDILWRGEFYTLGPDKKHIYGYHELAVATVDEKGVLLRQESYHCSLSFLYFMADFKVKPDLKSLGRDLYFAQKTSDPETAKLTVRSGFK